MLQQVIDELISPNQSAFLQGTHISDATLFAYELIRDFNSPMGSRMCLKLDLQKTFDTLNREFVYYLMHYMGFIYKWINWIKECFYSLILYYAQWLSLW